MKKFGAFLLAGVLAIGALTGCGSTDKKAESSTVSVVGVNPPADIAFGRIAEVRSRSMSCNCMTRTSQQECRGILEFITKSNLKECKSDL